jgi:hypothetical protein
VENRATVEHELDIARELGVNTLRIFLRWEYFTTSLVDPTVPVTVKQDLDEFLSLAASKHMKVLVTLFDGMPNEGADSIYPYPDIGIAHLDSLLTPFTNRNGSVVDFSTDCRIFAWDVKNEPDRDYVRDTDRNGIPGTPDDVATVQAWVRAIAGHLREKDPCHPVTVGIYGAVGGAYDPTIVGYYTDTVDFVSVHYSLDENDFPAVIDAVEALAGGKPIVVEEFALNTWTEHPSDSHELRDQAAYFNAILSTAEADHLAGAMFWTLTDFSYIEGGDEKQKHQGVLHNASVTTTEVPVPTDYGEKPAADVVREHFKIFVAYLDTFDGYVDEGNCSPPVGWTDNYSGGDGATIIACDPISHEFAPSELGRARLTKWAGPEGVITSTLLEAVSTDLSPQVVVDILTYSVRSAFNEGPIHLDIGVKAADEGAPTWLATDLVDSSVAATAGLKLPRTIYTPLPANWPAEESFQVVFRLQDQIPGAIGYSAGFELDCVEIGPCLSAPPPSVRPEGRVQKLFRDEFNGRSIDAAKWETVHGDPFLSDCGVVLTTTRTPGVPSKTQLRSHRLFQPTSMLVVGATTQNWQGKNKEGDTSFGFESWYTNCHNAVIVTSDGQLGLIRPEEGVDCSHSSPLTRECYLGIGGWNDLRTEAHEFTILWAPTHVSLRIGGITRATWDDLVSTGCVTPAIPQVPLHIRLNANVFNEDRDRLPGEENHYDADELWIDYVYVPGGVGLPVGLMSAAMAP